jgi:hypothetical protein
MKTKLFDDPKLTEQEIIDNLEAENVGVEECHTFIKSFSEEEQSEIETSYIEGSKELAKLKKELDDVSAPIKEKIKPIEKETRRMIHSINRGGEEVTEKVYCFADYESKVIGLYDRRGILIGTRPMTRTEKKYGDDFQLHINSHKNVANG